ncbi:MAG: fibronectin type III domain-containing protein [Owenweeksia sp.]|nr:fibronectin type III domain-containing protein [Owenweeksia sp.]
MYHLTSPPISITQDAQLRFFWSHSYSVSYPNDQLLVRIQNAGASTWDTIVNLLGAANFNDASAGNTSPGTFVEEDVILNPAKYTGTDVVIEFIGVSDWGPNLYLNDIYVENAPQCPNPAGLNATAVGDTFVTFNWTGSSSHTGYEVWFGPQGFYQGSQTTNAGHKVITSGDSLNVDTLRSATCYEFLVRAFCGNDTTIWQGPVSFCTDCRAFTAPYFEDFETSTAACWSNSFCNWNG